MFVNWLVIASMGTVGHWYNINAICRLLALGKGRAVVVSPCMPLHPNLYVTMRGLHILRNTDHGSTMTRCSDSHLVILNKWG